MRTPVEAREPHQIATGSGSWPSPRPSRDRKRLKIATYWWAGRRHVGRLSADGRDVTPLALAIAPTHVGALALVEAMAAGAPLPQAVRRGAAVVGRQARRADAACRGATSSASAATIARMPREFASTGFGGPRTSQQDVPELPIIFSKVPEMRDRPEAAIRLPDGLASPIDYEAELAVVIGKGGTRHPAVARHGPCLGLHHRQRRDRARRAGPPPAMGSGQVARHLLPDGPVARLRRRARRPRHARALLGQRRAAPGRAAPRT